MIKRNQISSFEGPDSIYVKLFMKTDVLFLADGFESFRARCYKVYELDPAHYYTTPDLTWGAMLTLKKAN